MEEENFKYYAFISYSHKDKKTAQRLHKRLRSYHLPSKLIQSHPELPKKLGSVFLDEANLVAKEGSLTESLQGYLRDSKFLILICSPDSAKSPYVNDEVEYFMKLGRRKHIIPLIVSGLPHSKDPNAECFVPAILNLSRELEPLGIDLKTYGERDSFLRIIATTLGLDLEYFISIEARERKRKAVIFSSVAAVLVIAIGTLAWYGVSYQRQYEGQTQFIQATTYYSNHDYAMAKEWFEKAAANGHSEAQFLLGMMYQDGEGVKQDYVKAIEWFEKAAKNGYVNAQIFLASNYDHGYGVSQDYGKAMELYEKVAALSNGTAQYIAQYNLGYMYEHGHGVSQDYTKAAEWYGKSAENGSDSAQFNLGVMYYNGRGLKQDYAKAAEWYEKAANNGNSFAQKELAKMYEKGLGVEKDPLKAQEWYSKAAGKDNK